MEIPMIRIPKDRIGALIGPDGETSQEIEERAGVRLEIDSESGEVFIHDDDAYDPVLVLKVQDIVKAIGRGFSPERAFRLFQDDCFFELLDLTEYVGRKQKQIHRVKGRIIGKDGRTREQIESLSGTDLSVYGKTVGLVGELEENEMAREAIEMLIQGAPHPAVYRFLEEKRKELRLRDLGLA